MVSCFRSVSSFLTSSKDVNWLEDAHSSSRFTRCCKLVNLLIWLLEMSRTRSALLFSNPETEVRALCEIYNSSSEVKDVKPLIHWRRFDWMDSILRVLRGDKFYNELSR